jgi:hypothetical protein
LLSAELSNFAPDQSADVDFDTYNAIVGELERQAPLIGKWNVVWGPAVLQDMAGYPMNTMYVAQMASDASQYVIGIAGTNAMSLEAWLTEDFLVSWQCRWPFASEAKISAGTALGLCYLLQMRPSSKVPGAGQSLTDFLSTITRGPVEITVTGHSLGAALAPVLAVLLADTQEDSSLWSPQKNATISTMPTAAPAIGNRAFGAHARKRLGAGLTPFTHSLDVVPHIWQEDMIRKIPGLYEPDLPYQPIVALLAGALGLLAAGGEYATLPGTVVLEGTYVLPSVGDDLEKFLLEFVYQHSDAYSPMFELNSVLLPLLRRASAIPKLPGLAEALARRPASPAELLSALSEGGQRKILIGGELLDMPRGPGDPRGDVIVGRVDAMLRERIEAPSAQR